MGGCPGSRRTSSLAPLSHASHRQHSRDNATRPDRAPRFLPLLGPPSRAGPGTIPLGRYPRAGKPAPRVIGVDEIAIGKGHEYRVVVSDLEFRSNSYRPPLAIL